MQTKEQKKEYDKEYYKNNREKITLRNKIYRAKQAGKSLDQIGVRNKRTKEEILKANRVSSRKHYRENREEVLKRSRPSIVAWREKNKEKIKLYKETLLTRFKNWQRSTSKSDRKKNLGFSLEFENIKDWPLTCYYTGVEFTLKSNQRNTVSLDRVDSNKGYHLDNVVFCATAVNRMKSDLSLDEFYRFCELILRNKK